MNIEFNQELNKCFEILGLLHVSNSADPMAKEIWVNRAEEYGINGEELYKKFGAMHKKYVSVFQQNMVEISAEEYDFFFSDEEFLLFLQIVCADHPQWFENGIDEMREDTIILAFADELAEDHAISSPPTLNEIIELLEIAGYSSSACWKLMRLLQSPKEKIKTLFHMINNNIPAFEKAIEAVDTPLSKQLKGFKNGTYFCTKLKQDVTITPILIYPIGEIVNSGAKGDNAYAGVFISDAYKMVEKVKNTRNNLLPTLKALSDNSKFDILVSLMTSPKYNLELAEELDLSAATISHHMGVLLSFQLVDVEKKEGRVYYTLSKERMDDLVSELRSIFSLS